MRVEIDVPEDLCAQAKLMADAHQISIGDVLVSAFAEHFRNWQRLEERAARGNREAFLRILDRVPDAEPLEYDHR